VFKPDTHHKIGAYMRSNEQAGAPNAPPPHVSPSALTSWSDCGKKDQLRRIIGLKESPAWWSFGGTGLHRASEKLDRQRFATTGK